MNALSTPGFIFNLFPEKLHLLFFAKDQGSRLNEC